MHDSDQPASNQPSLSPEQAAGVALPGLLAGLLDQVNAQGWDVPLAAPSLEDGFDETLSEPVFEPPTAVLDPEVLPPEEHVATTPTIEDMQQFLTGLRVVLEQSSHPPDALEDFADLTGDLLRAMTDALNASEPAPRTPFASGSGEPATAAGGGAPSPAAPGLLEQLMSQAETDETLTPPLPDAEATDLESLQRGLLEGLLVQSTPELDLAFRDARNELLGSLIESLDEPHPADAAPQLPAPPAALPPAPPDPALTASEPAAEPPTEPESSGAVAQSAPEVDVALPIEGLETVTRGLLDGLLQRVVQGQEQGTVQADAALEPQANAEPEPDSIGEVPLALVDESDLEAGERPSTAFDLLLDTIDAELSAAPALRTPLQSSANDASVATERVVAFQIGDCTYALPLVHVLETDAAPVTTFVPGLPAYFEGVANVRGEVLSVVDLRKWNLRPASKGEVRMLVVRESNTPRAASAVLLVDRLLGLVSLPASSVVPVQRSAAAGAPIDLILSGMSAHRGAPLGILDAALLFHAAIHGTVPPNNHQST